MVYRLDITEKDVKKLRGFYAPSTLIGLLERQSNSPVYLICSSGS